MAADPREAPDLDAAARNPDGTYNGAKALSWLSRVVGRTLHGSDCKGLSEAEVTRIWEEARARKRPNAFD